MKNTILAIACFAALFTACQDNRKTGTDPGTATSGTAPADETAGEAVISIRGGDDMKFNLSEIRVKEGQKVKLTLIHTGQADKSVMGHNFVLLSPEVSTESFAREAINAKDNDYIPASMQQYVIAHTRIIGGGESDVIEFAAPPKGVYDFICSFPGHYGMMKGTFITE